MRLKITLAALALAAMPSLALAEGCNWQQMKESATSCPDGTALDAKTGSCVKQVSSLTVTLR